MSGGFGLPRIDFSPLARLGQELSQAGASRDIGAALQAGDYTTAAKRAFDAGDPDTGLNLMKLGEAYKTRQLQQQESAAFNAGLGGAFGAGGPVASGAAPPSSPRSAGPSFADTSGAAGGYLATLRGIESGGNPNARNPNSTATGIDQFTSSTWAGLARKYPDLGLTANGRTDPEQSTRAMERFTADNAKALTAAGVPITPGNLYVSHFLGEAGGPKFIAGAMRNPDAPAVNFVSEGAARANRTIFYNRDGTPKTAGEVYAERTRKFGGTPQTQVAAADMPAADAQPAQFQIPPGATVGNQPAEAIAQSPLGQRIPFLLRAAGNANLPEPQRELAKTLLTRALDESKLPDEQKDYVLARSQGFGGTFLDYKRELKGGDSGFTLSAGQQRFDAQGRPLASVPDREKSNGEEAKLRGEFTKNLGSFTDVQDAYRRVIASTEQREADPTNVSPAADMSLIFGFMKMLDPGSVVREGEFASAQNAAGIPDRVRNAYNKALSGEFLQPEQRQGFIDQAQRLYGQARQSAEGTANRYSELAKGQGLDPSRVVQLPEAPRVPQVGKPKAAAPQGGAAVVKDGATATNPQTGEKIEFRGGRWVPLTAPPANGGPIT